MTRARGGSTTEIVAGWARLIHRVGVRPGAMIVAACTLAAGMLAACGASPTSSSASSGGQVLLVGTFHGHAGGYKTIQSAVDAARPGDWILVAPGDYHEAADESGAAVDPVTVTWAGC